MRKSEPAQTLLSPSFGGLVCGVDEAGRGPLAGSVVAAAVVLDPERPIEGLRDSKRLTAGRREALAALIRERALGWAVGQCTVQEIDTLNILRATMLAMSRAVAALQVVPSPELIEIDGNRVPDDLSTRAVAVIGGDDSRQAISAASILAKTTRDAQMMLLHEQFPCYGFDRHMGYGTAEHRQALMRHGPCPEHRRSFAPVRQALIDAAGRRGWKDGG